MTFAWRRRRGACAAAAVLVAAALGACRDPVASGPSSGGAGVLDHIVKAESGLAYHGYRIVAQGPIETSRQTRLHVVRTATGRMWIEWAREGDAPARRWQQTGSRFPWVERPDLVLRNYDVVLDDAPAPPVAWRESRRVRIVPRHPGRPSLEILVDAERWLVLADVRRDAAGAEVRSGRFETLTWGAPESGVPEDGGGADFGLRPADGPDGWTPWTVTRVPHGFERIRGEVCGAGWWYEHWSDGLATLTVSQSQVSGDAPEQSPAGSETEVTSRRLSGALALESVRGGVRVTVVGDVPEPELRDVLASLRRE